jgi:hypothetical protein
MKDEFGNKDSCISSKLEITKMPNVWKVFAKRSRTVSGRMVSKDASEYQSGPILIAI